MPTKNDQLVRKLLDVDSLDCLFWKRRLTYLARFARNEPAAFVAVLQAKTKSGRRFPRVDAIARDLEVQKTLPKNRACMPAPKVDLNVVEAGYNLRGGVERLGQNCTGATETIPLGNDRPAQLRNAMLLDARVVTRVFARRRS